LNLIPYKIPSNWHTNPDPAITSGFF